MEEIISRNKVGHIGVVRSAVKVTRRNHIRKLTTEQKKEILEAYKKNLLKG